MYKKGHSGYWTGKHMSVKHRRNIAAAKAGKHFTDEHKEKLRQAAKEAWAKRKKREKT